MKKKLVLVVLALALVLAGTFTGCTAFMGSDGAVSGSVWWPSGYGIYVYDWNHSGFPSASSVTKSTSYAFTPGSYYFEYELYDYYYYYTYNSASYTVTVNKGKLFTDGADKNFTIDCWDDGPSISGLNIVPTAPAKDIQAAAGETIKAYTDGELTITLKYKKIAAPTHPDSKVQLQ
jgi:hypothetical protein